MTYAPNPDFAATTALRLIGPDPQNWVPDRAGVDHNVVLVGGGQTGSALAFALRRAGIGKVSVIDAAEDEDRAGVWLTAARMNLLRTPKTLPGPELGIPALGFQSWYEVAIRRGCLCRDRPHPPAGLGAIPELVSAFPEDRRALPDAPCADRAGRWLLPPASGDRRPASGRDHAQGGACDRFHRERWCVYSACAVRLAAGPAVAYAGPH